MIASAITPQPMNDKRAPFKASDLIIFHFSFAIAEALTAAIKFSTTV
jgi:hypothetical protein